jgi:hypothetical protein
MFKFYFIKKTNLNQILMSNLLLVLLFSYQIYKFLLKLHNNIDLLEIQAILNKHKTYISQV